MEVITVSYTPDTHEKIHMLEVLRPEIGEDAFRVALAKISTIHLLDLMKYTGKTITRKDLAFRVNLTLMGYQCEPMSYGFFRSYF